MNAARAAMVYVDTTTERLAVDNNLSLRDQLEALIEPKYKTSADKDDDFRNAKEVAVLVLT